MSASGGGEESQPTNIWLAFATATEADYEHPMDDWLVFATKFLRVKTGYSVLSEPNLTQSDVIRLQRECGSGILAIFGHGVAGGGPIYNRQKEVGKGILADCGMMESDLRFLFGFACWSYELFSQCARRGKGVAVVGISKELAVTRLEWLQEVLTGRPRVLEALMDILVDAYSTPVEFAKNTVTVGEVVTKIAAHWNEACARIIDLAYEHDVPALGYVASFHRENIARIRGVPADNGIA